MRNGFSIEIKRIGKHWANVVIGAEEGHRWGGYKGAANPLMN